MPRNRVIKREPRHRVQGMSKPEYIAHHKACLVAYAESRREGANLKISENSDSILMIETKKETEQ